MEIPYTVQARPDTGLYNARLGVWLFLASEVMLFGGLFSGYVLLRTGALQWPHGWSRLSVPLASANTLVLIASSVTMLFARGALTRKNLARARVCMLATIGLATVFLAVKLVEYREHFAAGERPSHDNFFATYFTLTGMHALHVLGGIAMLAYLAGPGAGLWRRAPERYANRVETTAIYWYFVDLVWLVLFPVLYLT
jgi:heme/copper-type cytochrome/quinol oxidase subunit 3